MRSSRKTGFTLVEILIVVVILGILAAIVVPQFVNASDSAIKGALQSQLQTISSQIELYRVQESGAYPTEDPDSPMLGADNDGWGVMVGSEYLKEIPMNGYTKKGVVAGDADAKATSEGAARTDDNGWYYAEADEASDPPLYLQGRVFAAGLYENRDDADLGPELSHEHTEDAG